MAGVNKAHTPLVRISKRTDIVGKKAILIRVIAFVSALVISGILTAILIKGNPLSFYSSLIIGNFGTPRRIVNLLGSLAILLLISLAVTPAFKMRFWNIGAEGQALMGVMGSAVVIYTLGGKIPDAALLALMFVAAVVFGGIWGLIPAIFKAYFNTNETLFTLMMNYVAMCIINYFIKFWAPNGTGTIGFKYGFLPKIGGYVDIIVIIIVAVVTALVTVYLTRTKHGYELSVVGESENTARYVGINVKGVIIRTMALSGVLCGIVGFLLMGKSANLNPELVGGQGFTAILVSWLAKFNPIIMIGTSGLVVFLEQGSKFAADGFRVGASYKDIIVGLFFFMIIASEFFINYKLTFRTKTKEKVQKAVETMKEEAQIEKAEEEVNA